MCLQVLHILGQLRLVAVYQMYLVLTFKVLYYAECQLTKCHTRIKYLHIRENNVNLHSRLNKDFTSYYIFRKNVAVLAKDLAYLCLI